MKKVVFISGASSGLGLVLARKLILLNFKVYGGYYLKKPNFKDGIKYVRLNVTSDKSCVNVVKNILNKERHIDILINCAGITPSGPTLNYSSKQFQDVLQVNTIGPFRLIKEVALNMKKEEGLIINITSLNGFLALPHSGIYSASKFALEALGLSLRNELYANNISVVNIAPGMFVGDENTKAAPLNIFRLLFPFTKRTEVADRIIKVISERKYPPRVIIGTDAKIAYLLFKILPLSLFDGIIRCVWQKRGSLALRS